MPEKKISRTIQPEDLFRLRILREAKLSPDGKSAVYAVSQTAFAGEQNEADYSSLYLLMLDSGQIRELTSGPFTDKCPEWSPDGKTIAFISTREGKPQIFAVAIDGGELRQVTDLLQGVSGGLAWSPDGIQIAFTAGPTKTVDYSKPYYVKRNIYRFDDMGYMDNNLRDLYVVTVENNEPRLLVSGDCVISSPRWSLDGREILYLTTLSANKYDERSDLQVITLNGKPCPLVEGWGDVLAAEWLPDGERIVFIGTPRQRPIGSRPDVWVIRRKGGEPECRTGNFPAYLGGHLQSDMLATMQWMPPNIVVYEESGAVYVPVQAGGARHIYRIATSGPEDWSPVVTGERACMPVGTKNGKLLFAASDLNTPPDLFLGELDGSAEHRLTSLNTELLSEIHMPEVEYLSFKGVDGSGLEGWYIKPVEGRPPYPTILYVHGGPHSAFGHIFSFDFQMLAGAEYGVLLVNQRGSTGYGDGFATQIIGDWGNLDYLDLMAGVDYAIDNNLADPDRLGVCGLSGGGNLTCWIVGHTGRFKAAVPENPVTNWESFYGVSDCGPSFAAQELGGKPNEIPEVYRRCSPITYAHRCTTPTLLIQGEEDYRCPAEQSEQFYAVLKDNECVVEMLRLPGSSHTGTMTGEPCIRRAQNEALLGWMNRYVLCR